MHFCNLFFCISGKIRSLNSTDFQLHSTAQHRVWRPDSEPELFYIQIWKNDARHLTLAQSGVQPFEFNISVLSVFEFCISVIEGMVHITSLHSLVFGWNIARLACIKAFQLFNFAFDETKRWDLIICCLWLLNALHGVKPLFHLISINYTSQNAKGAEFFRQFDFRSNNDFIICTTLLLI